MSYLIENIITWAKISQALAVTGEQKKKTFNGDNTADEDLHIKLYDARKSLEWEYAQNSSSDYLYKIGNYVLSLCGSYLIRAQQISISGGLIVIPTIPTPGTPITMPFYIIKKSDFSNATDITITALIGHNISVFGNFVNRYLKASEYSLLSGGLVKILIGGFDSATFDTDDIILRIDVNSL